MRALAVLPMLFALACGPTSGGDLDASGGGDGGGANDGGGNGDGGGGGGSDGGGCGAQTEEIGLVNLGDPPDLLIVLDRSGSMAGPIPTFPPNFTAKWSIMRTALESTVMAKQNNIRFGLLEFPSDDICAADAVAEVPVGLGSFAAVQNYFQNRSPNGNTPAHLALQAALAYYQGIPANPAGQYVLFATDGLPNCDGGVPENDSSTATVAAVNALANAGFKTYVLGFGSFLGLDDSVLNDAALAGQVPRPGGPPHYYNAGNASELSAVLDQIAGGIIVPSCSFQLDSPPPEPENVTVTINGVPVPRSPSHADGWDYHPDPMTITFFGSYCTQIETNPLTEVSFAYGCPGPVVP